MLASLNCFFTWRVKWNEISEEEKIQRRDLSESRSDAVQERFGSMITTKRMVMNGSAG